jgi:ribonuclease D
VGTQRALDELVRSVQRSSEVALDTEFHGERTYVPLLMLLQLATRDAIHLIDPLARLDLAPLFAELSRPELTVVGHALRNDVEILVLRHGVQLSGLFDTQVAASLLGYGPQVGLVALMSRLGLAELDKSHQLADWSRRPLPERQARYAADDVRFLLLAYDVLHEQLRAKSRLGWLHEECESIAEPRQYVRDPEQAWKRLRRRGRLEPEQAGVLRAVAAERERLAAELDRVPHFLIPDEVLFTLAAAVPRSLSELRAHRGLAHEAVIAHAERFMGAVERGMLEPRPPRAAPPGSMGKDMVDRLLERVREVAEAHDLSPGLLIPRKSIEGALRERPRSRLALAEALGLGGWRERLLADALWDAIVGDRER